MTREEIGFEFMNDELFSFELLVRDSIQREKATFLSPQ